MKGHRLPRITYKHLAGKHDVKPSHEELKDWLHSGQPNKSALAKR
jgi:hypothetical protein